MKIVINAFSARQGGGQTYLINLLSHLPDDPHLELEVFAPSRLKLPDHNAIRRVESYWPTENPISRALWERWILPKYLKKTGADVLFCPGGLVVTKVPKGCKVVTMFRNMTPFDPVAMKAIPLGLQWLRQHMLRRLMLSSMSEADLTIFISNYARDVIEQLIRVPHATTIPHGISDAFRSREPAMPPPKAVGGQPYLLYVSKLDSYKHHHEVVRAFSLLPEQLKGSYRLILIGEAEGKPAERLRSFIDRLGLANNVLLLGAVPYCELPAFYQNATANLFASSCENCPNIMLEALAAGRPLLASNVPPMPEFGGHNIGYFSPFDPNSIAAAMRQVLEDDSLAKKWAEGAQKQGSLYNWSRTARQTWRAICKLEKVAGLR